MTVKFFGASINFLVAKEDQRGLPVIETKLDIFKHARELVFFMELVQQGTRKRAAELLNVDIKTARRYVTDLETILATEVLDKNKSGVGGIVLTPFGQKLYATILPKLERLKIDLEMIQLNTDSFTYSLAVFPIAHFYIVKHLLTRLHYKFPNVIFDLTLITPSMISRYGTHVQSMAEDFDMLMLLKQHLHLIDQDKWRIVTKLPASAGLYCSSGFLEQQGINIEKPEDLEGLNYLATPLESGQISLSQNNVHKTVQLKPICRLAIRASLVELVKSNLGIAILEENLLKVVDIGDKPLVKLLKDWHIEQDLDSWVISQKKHPEIDHHLLTWWQEDLSTGISIF